MIHIIDYGMDNLGSIVNMIKYLNGEAIVTNDHKSIEKAEKLILPGVGAFDYGMQKLKKLNLIPLLNYVVNEKKNSGSWNLFRNATND